MTAPAPRICPGCSRVAPDDHDCTPSRRHPAVRRTQLPAHVPQRTPTVAQAMARARGDHRIDDDTPPAAALARVRTALAALDRAAEGLAREPGAVAALRVLHAEDGLLGATDGLRRATGVDR